jgi:two-component system response regulator RegA
MNSERILVVDDDKTFCQILATSLRRRGHEVLVAHNGQEALEEVRAWSPSRVVTDLRMPGGSGISLVRSLNAEFPRVRVVVLTGFGSIASAVEAVKLGAVQYLTKPVSAEDVLRAFDDTSPLSADPQSAPQVTSLDVVEWEHLSRVLAECAGNVSEAARRLNMHRRTLQRKLARGRGD